MMKSVVIAALFVCTAGTGAALAGNKCDVPASEWQPREALQAKLESQGWKVRNIKSESGCYEAYAIDAKGKRVETMFDPKSLAPVGGDTDGDEG
ncbi:MULTISPECIES: PepSY domain-containing protein [unclassified Mesorhizobium]|uniref:PepSY domain-containing protein n=1 Tax=unclassified Mesorhizobium TaxID=325217 RepID=UPI0024160AA1|nr:MULTISPECIES: PepSY domain-containing protein [unclassified Mesorhizobium]WFP65007.1 PepSY domain-containing protein [Mesorhizobium sp. WSM4904]WFP78280.1 PepSY domain-containing protein [Mesorhizobium sp. WSM4906]